MRGKKSLASGANSHMKLYIESCGIMFSNDVEEDLELFGLDRRKYVIGGSLLRRRPNLSSRPKK